MLNVINGAHVAVKITVEEETHQYEQSPEALSELSSVYESPQTSDQEFTDADGVHYNLLPQLNGILKDSEIFQKYKLLYRNLFNFLQVTTT